MARGISNLSGISNNDLLQLRTKAHKHSKISVRAGTKKFEIEGVEASVLTGNDLSFVSIPATSAIYKDGALLTDEIEVKAAIRELKSTGNKKSTQRSGSPELPEELRKQLEAFAKEHKSRIIFDPSSTGGYKVQKLRTKRTSTKE